MWCLSLVLEWKGLTEVRLLRPLELLLPRLVLLERQVLQGLQGPPGLPGLPELLGHPGLLGRLGQKELGAVAELEVAVEVVPKRTLRKVLEQVEA